MGEAKELTKKEKKESILRCRTHWSLFSRSFLRRSCFTWVKPSGAYVRFEDAVHRTESDRSESFHYVENTPVNP